MSIRKVIMAGVLGIVLSGISVAQTVEVSQNSRVLIAKRMTLAVKYPEGNGTRVNMTGTAINPRATGNIEVKRKEGRTRMIVKLQNLGHPQALGAYYTTFVLWAIAPEGQAERLAELPIRNEYDFEVTTSFQTFGLIVTAEPHSAVSLPSPIIVAENTLRKGTDGVIEASRIEYSGDAGTFYVVAVSGTPALNADYETPLLILGARRAVEIARRAGAERYSEPELRQAEVKLEALDSSGRATAEMRRSSAARLTM